jgi:hypothetical protein
MKDRKDRLSDDRTATKSEERDIRTTRIRDLSDQFSEMWRGEALANADHRIDQTLQHFINIESAGFYDSIPDQLTDEISRFVKATRGRTVPKKIRLRIERKLHELVQMSRSWSKKMKAAQVEIDAMSYWAQESEGFYEFYGTTVRDLRKAMADAKAA